MESGEKTCAEAGVPRCYSEGVQYTIMDDYDEFISLGRALGLDSLFYTASFLRPLPTTLLTLQKVKSSTCVSQRRRSATPPLGPP